MTAKETTVLKIRDYKHSTSGDCSHSPRPTCLFRFRPALACLLVSQGDGRWPSLRNLRGSTRPGPPPRSRRAKGVVGRWGRGRTGPKDEGRVVHVGRYTCFRSDQGTRRELVEEGRDVCTPSSRWVGEGPQDPSSLVPSPAPPGSLPCHHGTPGDPLGLYLPPRSNTDRWIRSRWSTTPPVPFLSLEREWTEGSVPGPVGHSCESPSLTRFGRPGPSYARPRRRGFRTTPRPRVPPKTTV